MGELINILDVTRMTPPTDMPLVELFDPPMCCPTGLCGPALDQTLLSVNEMVISLAAEGVLVARYQMTSHPLGDGNRRRPRDQRIPRPRSCPDPGRLPAGDCQGDGRAGELTLHR